MSANLKMFSIYMDSYILKILFIVVVLLIVYSIMVKCLMYHRKPRIAVCMWYDDAIKEYGHLTEKINRRYCLRNQYDFIFSNTRHLNNRHPAWEKIKLLYDSLRHKHHDYIIWIDADAIFNPESTRTLESIIEKHRDKDILFSGDDPNYPEEIQNNGFWIVKNTYYSTLFLEYIIYSNDINQCRSHFKEPLWEQACINHLYRINLMNIQQHSIIIPYKELQIFPERHTTDEIRLNNSLVLHQAGTDHQLRIDYFKNMCRRLQIIE